MEEIYQLGMQVVELDIYGFPIKEKGVLRVRTIIDDVTRTNSVLNNADVPKKYSTLEFVALSICRNQPKMFIPLEEFKNKTPW